MDKIAKVKSEVQPQTWEQWELERQRSGLTVEEWCREQHIGKSAYYRLRKLREICAKVSSKRQLNNINDLEEDTLRVLLVFDRTPIYLAVTYNCAMSHNYHFAIDNFILVVYNIKERGRYYDMARKGKATYGKQWHISEKAIAA